MTEQETLHDGSCSYFISLSHIAVRNIQRMCTAYAHELHLERRTKQWSPFAGSSPPVGSQGFVVVIVIGNRELPLRFLRGVNPAFGMLCLNGFMPKMSSLSM